MTFYTFSKKFKDEISKFGDLARDILADKSFPKKTVSVEKIRKHLEKNYACEQCLETFKEMAVLYSKSK